jgi:spermidine synthase
MNRAWLYAVVAISGACVLAIEILGTRLLGPFYGVSLFLWSALISVTLAALSVGYAVGGRLADRSPSPIWLARWVAGAGIWMLLVPWLRAPLLAAGEALGLRGSVLIAAFALFFPPLALLGMVSPYAIRIHTSRIDQVGRTAGDLYAVSTVASVGAALLTGFWLIPNIGVTRLASATGLLLLLAALIAWLSEGPSRNRPMALLLIALPGAGGAWRLARPESAPSEQVRFIAQSPYAEIRVVDRKGLRYLLIDGGTHSIVKPGTPEIHLPYVHAAELVKELFRGPGDLLLVGLGSGSTAHLFARDGWKVDAVEIDPVVVRVAREHFALRPADAAIQVMDGRRFLASAGRRYDAIFLDAFGSSSIPFHLVTAEAMAAARARLRPGGVLALNVQAVGWHDPLVQSLGVTLRTRFPDVLALPIAEPPNRLGNLILIASDHPMEISDDALGHPIDWLADPYLHWRILVRNHAWDNRFVPGSPAARVLTDDLNPADVWAERINLAARRDLHALFGHDTPSW